MKKIKWACIQPLTGGMYLGAEAAIGHPAEWILSYKGLDEIKYNNEGEPTVVANEAYLNTYLKKKDRMPLYYQMDRAMFDEDLDNLEPDIYLGEKLKTPKYNGLDLVVAVPVCSGLSTSTIGTKEGLMKRNLNMLYIANLALRKIKPKIYIFENAPTLMGYRGDYLREEFERLAEENGYVVIYYKTDTARHHNCQRRQRTFVLFVQKIKGENYVPKMDFVNEHILPKDYFDNIPNGLPNDDLITSDVYNYMVLDFLKYKYGDEMFSVWTKDSAISYCIANNLLDEFAEYIPKNENSTEKEKENVLKYINHIKDKLAQNSGWFSADVKQCKDDYFPAVMYKTIPSILHPNKTRFCTIREMLELMGMPRDFEWFGGRCNLGKIGQNVPVKTAEFIVGQAVNMLENWKNSARQKGTVYFYDNIKQTVSNLAQHKTSKLF